MRVLVVDADEVARRAVGELVRALGHPCADAVDGESAWAAVVAGDVDVVITDVRLPGFDGLELCRRIRARDVEGYTCVIVLADPEGHDDALEAVRAGADGELPKPPDPLHLEARLVAAARVTDLHRQLADRRADLARLNAELEQAVRTDALTGLYNRRRLEEDCPLLDEGLRRYDRPFAVAMADVDCFKAYNDEHGHPAGDDVLRRVSAAIRRTVRQGDLAYRYGGEEFLFVFPVRGLGSVRVAAERVRVGVEALGISHARSPSGLVTISVGVAEATAAGGVAGAIEQADAALYDAKAAGRNRVVVAPPAVPARIDLG